MSAPRSPDVFCTGSNLHIQRVLRSPRWEDFEYELEDEGKTSFYWFGDGQTYNEKTMTGSSASGFLHGLGRHTLLT